MTAQDGERPESAQGPQRDAKDPTGASQGDASGQPPAGWVGQPSWEPPPGQPGWTHTADQDVPWGHPPAGQPTPAGAATDQQPTWGAPAPTGDGRRPSSWKPWQKVAAGGALAAVMAVGGFAAVSAANASSGETSVTQAGFADGGYGTDGAGGRSGAFAGRGGMGQVVELANALHGDFVVSNGTGTRTMRLQAGEIRALSSDSVTVQSADGYTSSYSVGSGLDVSSLAVGDTVRVIGTVEGDSVAATSIRPAGTSGSGQEQMGGMQPPEGMTPPNDTGQAPQTS